MATSTLVFQMVFANEEKLYLGADVTSLSGLGLYNFFTAASGDGPQPAKNTSAADANTAWTRRHPDFEHGFRIMPNRYSAKPRFGLIREMRFAGFGLCGCNRPRYEEMTICRFGLIREGGFGTWHGTLGTAPHLEQCGLLGLNWATIFSLALDNSTVF